MMKGLQGERLRQSFKFLDQDLDGFIRPDQFKRIILVRTPPLGRISGAADALSRKSRVTSSRML